MRQDNTYSGRLFLAKGIEGIFVDVEKLLPHQLEGIRFLYRQFKKQKPGVILNDPTGYGKTLQVILFIKAVKPLLKKPIVILCSDHEKAHWFEHFQQFTDHGDGVFVEPTNVNLRKMCVCITTKGYVDVIVKREWSILVVDDSTAINDVLKKKINTEFKIWLTSVDMKSNLNAYWKIFAWLYPKEKNIENIISEMKAKQGNIEEQILLDAAMEDVVLRRINNGSIPFGDEVERADTHIKVSRKNKDKTGTKIKKSKKSGHYHMEENYHISYKPRTKELVNMHNNKYNDEQYNDNFFKTNTDITNDKINDETSAIVENVIQSTNIIENASLEDPVDLNYEMGSNKKSVIPKANNEAGEVQDILKMSHESMNDEINLCEFETNQNPHIMQIEHALLNDSNETNESIPMEVADASLSFKAEQDLEKNKNQRMDTDPSISSLKKENSTNGQPSSGEKNEATTKIVNKSIDEYMKEMEEKALKKFKGSILDSIF